MKYSAFLLHVPPGSTVTTPVQVSQPPLCGPPSGSQREVPVDDGLAPVAGDAEHEVARVPLERVGEELRRRVGRAVRARALGEPHALVGKRALELGLAARVAGVAVERGAVDPARRPSSEQPARVLGLGLLARRRRGDVVRGASSSCGRSRGSSCRAGRGAASARAPRSASPAGRRACPCPGSRSGCGSAARSGPSRVDRHALSLVGVHELDEVVARRRRRCAASRSAARRSATGWSSSTPAGSTASRSP